MREKLLRKMEGRERRRPPLLSVAAVVVAEPTVQCIALSIC